MDMTNLVDPSEVESIVGARRHKTSHLCRTVNDIVYILHSQQCIEDYPDLRKCPFSRALDRGAYVVGGVGGPTELCIARYPLEKLKEKLPLRTESFFASRGHSLRNWGVEVL